jgi:parallel beta-helix repeat protein
MLEARTLLSTYYVSPSGNDAAAGTSSAPWRTLQRAANAAIAGDTVNVRPGNYTGFNLVNSGTASSRIVFHAEPGAIIDVPITIGNTFGINGSGKQYITIEGFTFRPQAGQGEWYCGVRLGGTPGNWVNGNVIRNNTFVMRVVDVDATPDKYGIYTSWNDGLLVEGNRVTGCYNSGIYVANSSRNYIVRANEVADCGGNGIHNNGDLGAGSPGINYNGLIERNVIHNVGFGIGGQAISCDAVQDSVIRNNLLYDIHAKGISLYVTNGAAGSKRNLVINNTVLVAADGQVPMRLNHNSSNNTVLNNIFWAATPSGAWTDSEESGLQGSFFDYNVTTGIALVGGVRRNDWHSTYGFDEHSIVSNPTALFVNAAANDYHLKSTSPAIDIATATSAPTNDFDNLTRPVGAGFDIGAYEYRTTGTPQPPAAPSNLAAALAGNTRIDLSWSDNSDNETGFLIERRIGSGSWVQIALVGAGVTSYSDTGLAAGTAYSYRTRSTNAAGPSAYSNTAGATTPSAPSAPTALSATALSPTSVRLTWNDVSNNETGFLIERRTGSGSYELIATIGANATAFTDTGLAGSTQYTYRVRATNAVGNSTYSNTATVQTPVNDTTPPVAQLGTLEGVTGGAITYTFTVRFTDDVGIDVGLLDGNDVLVTGPNGFSQLAQLIGYNGAGNDVTATYRITAPGGSWDLADNGAYAFAIRAGQVRDLAGNAVPAGQLGELDARVVPPDTAGNDFPSARAMGAMRAGLVRVAEDYVGAFDRNDFFKITLDAPLRLNVKLYNLTDNADLMLLDSAGNRIAYSKNVGAAAETFTVDLVPGTYYLRVLYLGSLHTPYRLRLEGIAPSGAPIDPLESAEPLGELAPGVVRVAEDEVGVTNRNDYYSFSVGQTTTVSLKLYNLTDDADVMILDSAGNRIAYSNRDGTSTELLTLELGPGNYFVRVLFTKGVSSTTYRLRLAGE